MQPFTDPRPANLKRTLLLVLTLTATFLVALYIGQTATAAELNGGLPMPGPNLGARKWASSSIVASGQTFSYTIALHNMSNVSATVTITDPLPLHVTYVTGSATGSPTYDAGTRTLVWADVTVPANGDVRLVFDVTADTVNMPLTILNVAKIAVSSYKFEVPAWVMIVPEMGFPSSLERSFKMAARPVVAPGDLVTYTIKLINSSPLAVTANVTDPVPSQLTYVTGSATGGGVYDAGSQTLSWSAINVPPFGHVALSFAATAPISIVSPTLIANVATISSGSHSFERRAYVVIFDRPVPPPHPILGGSYKAASQRIVVAGNSFTYTINLINSGTEDAIADVSDPLPDQLTYVFDSASNGGVYDSADQIVSWNAITVPAGTSLPLTFVVSATTDITRPTPVENTATITVANPMTTTLPNVLHREAHVLLVPSGINGDVWPPVVRSLTIDDQDVLTSPTVTLHISATDNISVSQMFIREWQLTSSPHPHWEVTRSSGWVPYQADYDWGLGSRDGTHFVGVWVQDAAHNISRLERRAFDFASLVQPGASVAQRGLVPYLVYYDQGVNVTATLTTLTGDADLYLWRPNNHFGPDFKSTHPISGTDLITFTTQRAGVYLFVVRGYVTSTYDLTIEPAGGPRVPWSWWSMTATSDAGSINLTAPSAPSAKTDDLTYDAVLPQSGVDPLAEPSAIVFPYSVFLPALTR